MRKKRAKERNESKWHTVSYMEQNRVKITHK
jgi:hypothetical protein